MRCIPQAEMSSDDMKDDSEKGDYSRRDFLKGGSVATLMTMLGGVELIAQTNQTQQADEFHTQPTTVAVIGLGTWGKEIVNNLARMEVAIIAGLCDTYEAGLNRVAKDFPKAL